MGYVVVAAVAVAVAVFAMQNTAQVVVKFLVWEVADVPVAAVVLASFGVGVLAVGIPALFKLWRLRSRLARAEKAAIAPGHRVAPAPEPPPSRPFGI
jgi:uncharacterized integral membrane protein